MWSLNRQSSRVFGWTNILSRWNEQNSVHPPEEVQTVLANLKRDNSPPTSHFLTYLNEEQDGLKWFIYECIASSWTWSTGPRLHYIKEALDLIDNLSSTFPAFPGSPLDAHTVRTFLTNNLSQDDLVYIQMMPPLVSLSSYAYQAQADADAAADAAADAEPRAQPSSSKPAITIHVIRDRRKDTPDDDIITIKKVDEDTYSYSYRDAHSATKSKGCVHHDLSGEDVIAMIRLLLNLLPLDDDPFDAVQLMLPSTPAILLDIESLSSHSCVLIYDSIEMVMKSWPTKL